MTPEAGAEQENHLGIFLKIQVWGPWLALPRRGGLGGTERSQVDSGLGAFPTSHLGILQPYLRRGPHMPEIRARAFSVLSQGTWVKATDIASRQSWEDSAQLLSSFRHWESPCPCVFPPEIPQLCPVSGCLPLLSPWCPWGRDDVSCAIFRENPTAYHKAGSH